MHKQWWCMTSSLPLRNVAVRCAPLDRFCNETVHVAEKAVMNCVDQTTEIAKSARHGIYLREVVGVISWPEMFADPGVITDRFSTFRQRPWSSGVRCFLRWNKACSAVSEIRRLVSPLLVSVSQAAHDAFGVQRAIQIYLMRINRYICLSLTHAQRLSLVCGRVVKATDAPGGRFDALHSFSC